MQRREVDAAGEDGALVAQVAHRVLGEVLERLRHASALLGERARQLVRASARVPRRGSRRCGRRCAPRTETTSPSLTASKSSAPATSISSTPPRTSSSGPGFGKRPDLRRRAVDDDARAGVEQLLGRDAVDVAVVDDRDVAAARAAASAASSCRSRRAGPGELDAVLICFSVSRNSAPPSIRSSSLARSSSSSCAIRVCVGSPGTFSTLKCRSARPGDLRQVRDRDHLRLLRGARERTTDGVRGLAADARVELVEDERVAARDDRDRQRDPRQLAARRRVARPARAAGRDSAG